MHRNAVREQSEVRHLSHLNSLFTGRGSRVYDVVMVRLTRRLYHRVIADLAALQLVEGKVLDAGTGPGTLVRELARRLPGLQVYGIDLSEDMIGIARAHARREQLEERVQFESGDVGHLPYPDQSFDVVVSTISMHHWYELEHPLRKPRSSTGWCEREEVRSRSIGALPFRRRLSAITNKTESGRMKPDER